MVQPYGVAVGIGNDRPVANRGLAILFEDCYTLALKLVDGILDVLNGQGHRRSASVPGLRASTLGRFAQRQRQRADGKFRPALAVPVLKSQPEIVEIELNAPFDVRNIVDNEIDRNGFDDDIPFSRTAGIVPDLAPFAVWDHALPDPSQQMETERT